MAMTFPIETGTKKEPISADNYEAVCFNVWYVGKQKFFNKNKNKEDVRQEVVIGFELPVRHTEGIYAGKKSLIYKKLTLSFYESAQLRKYLAAWKVCKLPESQEEELEFDWEVLIGKGCMLNVTINERGYNDIISIAPLPKTLKVATVETSRDYLPTYVKNFLDKQIKPVDTSRPTHEQAMKKKADEDGNFYGENGELESVAFDDRPVNPNMDEPGY